MVEINAAFVEAQAHAALDAASGNMQIDAARRRGGSDDGAGFISVEFAKSAGVLPAPGFGLAAA
ncbi:hypothetical protein [Pseudoroseomonas ludipueritiae]|uniref:Uncharacterized protein n=1 Tax=Pseudoroseomonas ludipueritiae TaxID=198093 RepID=A0ABR7R317_9PROT|nr:hypothetical protein [Pseudoroseomonas ludipueritiae]MBC9176116.1 hypothetical protein [Pseudoroseomonas ludipueritiae]